MYFIEQLNYCILFIRRFQDEDNLRVVKDSFSKEVTVPLRKYGWAQIPSNSHLFYTNRLAVAGHTQSMMDVRLNDDEIRRNRSVKILQSRKC